MSRPAAARLCALAALLLAATACEREARRFHDQPPRAADIPPGAPAPYQQNAWAIAEGQRSFVWFNCAGCHSNGGGGMGPSLMDEKWLYGSEPADIYASIVEGRPNGMPAFRGRLTDRQVWQLVGYVRSMGGRLRKDLEPGRSDSINARPAPQATENPPPRPDSSAP